MTQGRRPIGEHVADFLQALEADQVTPQRAAMVGFRVRKIIDGCNVACWNDITASGVQGYLDRLKRGKSNPKPIAANTFNGWLQSIKQFCGWMVKDGRATVSPIAHLSGRNRKRDRRHIRRALTVDEVTRLLDATASGPDRYGMAGTERAMLYRLAVETGLRAGELRTLTRAAFDLAGDPPTVTVAEGYTKNRKLAVQELRPATARELADLLSNKAPAAVAFNLPPIWNVIDILKADLEAAGVPYSDADGRVADFHSFRHTCGAWLAASGAHPKVIQSIMRHSNISLTMDTYGHRLVEQESAALAKMPDLSTPAMQAQRMRATGTDNGTPYGAHHRAHQTSHVSVRNGAMGGQLQGPMAMAGDDEQTLENKRNDEGMAGNKGEMLKATAGTRTQDLRITNASLYQLSYGGVGIKCTLTESYDQIGGQNKVAGNRYRRLGLRITSIGEINSPMYEPPVGAHWMAKHIDRMNDSFA